MIHVPRVSYLQSTPAVHALLEWLAYFAGARVYFHQRRENPIDTARINQLLLLACTLFGAAVGALGLHIAESWSWISEGPISHWISGKSLLGGLLGGTAGTEIGKQMIGWGRSTGDAWVPALVLGIVIGRIGCQLSGTWDMTYGSPTGTSWGWNYGDGVPRYPTALMELIAVFAIWAFLHSRPWSPPGQMFNAFMLAYCLLRVLIEFLKPPFGEAAPGAVPVDRFAGLTAIQWVGLAGAVWMGLRMKVSRRVVHG